MSAGNITRDKTSDDHKVQSMSITGQQPSLTSLVKLHPQIATGIAMSVTHELWTTVSDEVNGETKSLLISVQWDSRFDECAS